MRRRVTLAIAMAGALLVAASQGHGQETKGQPFELLRSLQSLQDQVVRGNARAHAAQRELLAQIGEQFDSLSDEGWREPRNARAAIVFVLSGGNARVLQKLSRSEGGKPLPEKLVQGVQAFGEGRLDQAHDMLSGVDARTLDPGLAGHVAYVQGELASKKDTAKALAYFEDARLLSPGTIVEEAALRRQIGLLSPVREIDRYTVLSAHYLRRFSQSVYSAGFKQAFAGAMAQASAADSDRLTRIEALLGGVAQADRRDIYLDIAKEAVGRANIDMARFAARHAARLAEDGNADRERALLYEAAARIVTDEFDEGVGMLHALDAGKMPEADLPLREAALSVAAQVRRPPAAAMSAPEGQAAQITIAQERARRAIAHVDEILTKAEAR